MDIEIQSITEYLTDMLGDHEARIGMVLGSGFADWISTGFIVHEIPYGQIPGFPVTSVMGHHGRLYLLQIGHIQVLVMQGRFHYYEGHSMSTLTMAIRVLKKLGIQHLILTNAAGGINNSYQPGDLMIIEDHINLSGDNPLIGPNAEEYGPRFPDTSQLYSKKALELAMTAARKSGIVAHRGVYIYVSGPSFETPAEIRMMRTMGADAVGMSTVPEALVAHHAGMSVLGISLISNLAAGMSSVILDHQEVLDFMQQAQEKVFPFLNLVISHLSDLPAAR